MWLMNKFRRFIRNFSAIIGAIGSAVAAVSNIIGDIVELIDRLGSFLMISMFIVVLLVVSITVVAAYWDLQETNQRIVEMLGNISDYLDMISKTEKKETASQFKAFLEQLKTRVKGTLDSSTISFLFQVFAVALLSSGVYLLSRSHRHLRMVEGKAREIAKFIESSSTSSAMEGNLKVIYNNVGLLTTGSDETTIAFTRDSLKNLRDMLEQADRNQTGMERRQHVSFLDQIVNILSNLSNMPDDMQDRVTDLKEYSKDCLNLLQTSGFVNRYEEQLKTLLEGKPTEYRGSGLLPE